MPNQQIQLDAPNLGVLEKEYLLKALDSGFVSTAGPYVPEFESKFAVYLGANSACVAVQSETAALHMALYEFDSIKDIIQQSFASKIIEER